MKNLSIALIITLALFTSCKKESATAASQQTKPADTIAVKPIDTSAVLQLAGSFMSGMSETVIGQAKIYLKEGKNILALEDFSSTNGPALKVYLSKEMYPVNFVKLGDLQALSGNQLYDIPDSVDFTAYKYALIHCEKYNHLYGYAELVK